MLSPRQIKLVKSLFYQDRPYTSEELAKTLSVSVRTVQMDIQQINKQLRKLGCPEIRMKRGEWQYGLLEEEKIRILRKILEPDLGELIPSGRRCQLIILFLTMKKQYITIQQIAEKLDVSRSTIVGDLKHVKAFCTQYGIEIITKPNFGIAMDGEELRIRNGALNMLLDPTEIFGQKFDLHALDQTIGGVLFDGVDIEKLRETLLLIQNQMVFHFSEEQRDKILIYLIIALGRARIGKYMDIPKEDVQALAITKEYETAKQALAYFFSPGKDSMTKEKTWTELGEKQKEEAAYLAILLKGMYSFDFYVGNMDKLAGIQKIAEDIIDQMKKNLGEAFQEDGELYNGLIQDLNQMIFRKRYYIRTSGELSDMLKDSFQYVEAARKSTASLESYVHQELSIEELEFVALHFVAARSRYLERRRRTIKTLVICANGVGTSLILKSRLQENIAILDIVAASPLTEAEYYVQKYRPELIITTVAIKDCGLPQVIVKPSLPVESLFRIYKAIRFLRDDLSAKGLCHGPGEVDSVQKIMDVIGKYAAVKNKESLQNELEQILKGLDTDMDKTSTEVSLKEVLTEKTIQLACEAKSWKEALFMAAGPLLEEGWITMEYAEAAYEISHTMGSYIVIGPGIAMPHARPEMGVKRLCMSLTLLKEPVEITEGTEIDMIFFFGAEDQYSHVHVLKSLMNLLAAPKALKKIRKAEKKKEILELIKSMEEC